MDKKQEESVPEESVPESSAADYEIASSIPRVVPDLREGLESAHLMEPPADGSSEKGSNMESSVADTAESVQKSGTSKESSVADTAESVQKPGTSMESSLAGTAKTMQKSGTFKESITSKPEKSGLSVESTGVAGTKSEVSAPGQSTEKSKSSAVSVTIPTEEDEVEKSEEVEKEEEVDSEQERKSARRYMVIKILQVVLAATMALQVLSIWGYFVIIYLFYVVIAVEETPEMILTLG